MLAKYGKILNMTPDCSTLTSSYNGSRKRIVTTVIITFSILTVLKWRLSGEMVDI